MELAAIIIIIYLFIYLFYFSTQSPNWQEQEVSNKEEK
jgi:hypothetical protein